MNGRVFFLIHYYYGDRFQSFQTGLGTIIRAAGHSKEILVYVLDDSYSWIDPLREDQSIPMNILSTVQDKDIQKTIFDEILSVNNHVCLISNIDLLLDSGSMDINVLLDFIADVREKNEIILTCQSYYPELETESDYVSLFKVKDI